MEHQAIGRIGTGEARGSGVRRDWLLAGALALVLSACWAMRDWSHLAWMILPDTDDMVRLAQVRDWLAGQAINDWTQYRMAPPQGAPMHWSRVNDAPIAALILIAGLFTGRGQAELFAVLAYPALLFGVSLFLTARIARRLWGAEAAPVAAVLGGVALPGTVVFLPGRIDHHALQVVLIEVAVLAAMRRPRFGAGAALGVAVALSLAIGLETAAQLTAVMAVAFILWVARGTAEQRRLAGIAAGLGGTTAVFALFLRPTLWSPALCDAFTPASAFAALGASAILLGLAAATPRFGARWMRLVAGAALGAGLLALLVRLYPACLAGPYGQVDPFLRREFIAHIEEANGIGVQMSVARILQLVGLLVVACVVLGWLGWRQPRRWPRWAPVAAVVASSALVTLAQVRGTYIGTPLAAPLAAGVVLAARRRASHRPLMPVGAWLVSAGLFWATVPPLVAKGWTGATGASAKGRADVVERSLCNDGPTWAAVGRYPPGLAMASTNVAAYLVGATPMSTVGAGYHRNDRGNMAMYRYFLSPPERAARIARAWRVRYVVHCPGDFGEIDLAGRFPRSIAFRLSQGRPPAELQRLPLRGSSLALYRIRD